MPSLGAPELIIVLFLALILFGAGKLADAGKSLGTGIKEFRKAVQTDDAPVAQRPQLQCPQCHATVKAGDRFCGTCGQSLVAEPQKAI